MSAEPWFPVTHPHEDAPDGTILHLPDHQGVYRRSGREWCLILDLTTGHHRPGRHVLDGEVVDLERCASRKRERGRIKCRCTELAGHDDEHWNQGAGRRWPSV